MSAIVTERSVECRGDVCSLWAVITDTERMNRAVGMDRIRLVPLADGSAARYLASTRLGMFEVEYEERPFEWVFPKSFKVLRRMRRGPLVSLEMAFALEPTSDGGTRVTLKLTMDPKLGLLGPLLRVAAGQTLSRFEREIRHADEALASGARLVPVRTSAVREDPLARALGGLGDTDPALVKRLGQLVREGPDDEVARIRPFALADLWSADRRALLEACLRGVRAGLFELRWEVVCPSCRTATETLPSLTSLTEHGSCQLCELTFGLELDEAVEATFAPSRAVREVDAGPYCVGGPARTPHVVAQAILPPGGEARLVAPDEPGRYRLFVRGGAATRVDLAAGFAASVELDAAEVEAVQLAPGGALVVRNPGGAERHAKLERVEWARQAATARDVTSMAAFRRDFSADTLRPGTALKVSRVGLFFSDLTGSTQLYSNVGDAAAFALVQDHFEVVIGLVERHHGTLVKTIGDAVMSVFADDLDGLAASLAILEAFETFRRKLPHYDQTDIKLGLYGGPCYVVTANGILDYFGQTVNIAARLQAEAKSGELVIEASFADLALEKGVLPVAWVRQRYEASLKGVARPVLVARIARPSAV